MPLKLQIFVAVCIVLVTGCKKNFIREDKKYELKFQGVLKPFCSPEETNVFYRSMIYTCQSEDETTILFTNVGSSISSQLVLNDGLYSGNLCGHTAPGTLDCQEVYLLRNGKVKFRFSKFNYTMTGDVVIQKFEPNCSMGDPVFNVEHFVGTFTLQPLKK